MGEGRELSDNLNVLKRVVGAWDSRAILNMLAK